MAAISAASLPAAGHQPEKPQLKRRQQTMGFIAKKKPPMGFNPTGVTII
jgi:hypothetical protein